MPQVSPNLVSDEKYVFLDGKAYKIFYLKDDALINMNSLPHKLAFNGEPRDVLVDGTPYRMSFGQSIDVVLDGQKHSLCFGSPGRELYVGNSPFKGGFDGAPIIINIAGRQHEIKLCGPTPTVKIALAIDEFEYYMQHGWQDVMKEAPLDVRELLKDLNI